MTQMCELGSRWHLGRLEQVRLETMAMTNKQFPPGHEEASIEGLKAEWVALAQRLTQVETTLAKAIKMNQTCASTAVVLAVLAVFLAIANTVYLVVRAWS